MTRSFAALLGAAILLAGCGQGGEGAPNARLILAEDPAPKLSDYGFFKDAGARSPVEGVRAYDLVNPLFSDHAAKHRFAYVPKGQAAKYDADDVFDFPIGAVLIKTFAFAPDMRQPSVGERYVETRLLIRKSSGWAAYPYIWNADQTEAVYSPIGGRQHIDAIAEDGKPLAIDYAVPNRNQCKECHQSGGVFQPIGPKARNLNHAGPYGVNEIADWSARGMLSGAPAADQVSTAPAAFDPSQPLGLRARAYLDINCAHCHKAGGGASNSGLFLGWRETDPRGWGVHKRPTAAGNASGQNFFVIEPGQPDQSILVTRMESTVPGIRMPELSRSMVDETGVSLIREWVAAMPPEK